MILPLSLTQKPSFSIPTRLRRLRSSSAIRTLVEETTLQKKDFVQPLFLQEGKCSIEEITSMPHVFRYSIDEAKKKIAFCLEKGIFSFALFPVISHEKKSFHAREALSEEGVIPQALIELKKSFPEAYFIVDIALDPYTSHGHDGLLDERGEVANDPTIDVLQKMSILYASCGADMLAPSDMMDGRIGCIRKALDDAGWQAAALLSYSAKYASTFYGPFRNAVKAGSLQGTKASYQLNPANKREALLEAELDAKEHADILMITPAGHYVDIISSIKSQTKRPIAAYHVSGEYAMILAAEEKGIFSAEKAFFEVFLSIKRAGADLIFTYAIDYILPYLEK